MPYRTNIIEHSQVRISRPAPVVFRYVIEDILTHVDRLVLAQLDYAIQAWISPTSRPRTHKLRQDIQVTQVIFWLPDLN
jgi:hypothetical protein